MKKKPILLTCIAASLAVGAFWLALDNNSSNAAHSQAQRTTDASGNNDMRHPIAAEPGDKTALRSILNNNDATLAANGQASPFAAAGAFGAGAFGAGASNPSNLAANAPEPEIVPPEEAARRVKMRKLGYMVPTEYYQKDLATLRQMAKNGDAYAMVHLGEKYYFELNGNQQNPEFDPKLDYGQAARQAFSEALAAGNIRSAAIIAETYLQENNKVDAYAWHLISEQLGDSISAEWFKTTKAYTSLTPEEKQQARNKMPDLVQNLKDIGRKLNAKPIFSQQS
jgi:hypothetical protein